MLETIYAHHLQISFRVPQELTKAQAAKANPIVIQNHFATLEKLIYENCLTPDIIWNMDESGFNISARLAKVIAQKGIRQVHKTAAENSKEHISVCLLFQQLERIFLHYLFTKVLE